MMQHILSRLQKFAEKWVFNYEHDIDAEARIEREVNERKQSTQPSQSHQLANHRNS
jgi:hypothetical protein